MAFLSFNNVAITGISACVPKNIINNVCLKELMSESTLYKTIKTTGINERRITSKHTCSSDLCYEAASKLLNEMDIDRKSIDMLIFVTQTPDFRIPSTALILQDRLGLLKSTGAFDVNLGCSGFVYGLSIAFSYASQNGINRILLLVGDTISKVTSPKDKATVLLFGDGGSATLIEKKDDEVKSYFTLNSDGSGCNALTIRVGGYRCPSNVNTLNIKEYENCGIGGDENLFMDGIEVFNFAIREIPKDINEILNYSSNNLKNIDFIIYHQANRFIIDYFTKILKYPIERVPCSYHKFGNTSGASIPLTIVSELREKFNTGIHKIILCGFGAGFSWATALLELSNCYVADLVEL